MEENMQLFHCQNCKYTSKYKHNVTRHEKSIHGKLRSDGKQVKPKSQMSKRPVIIPAATRIDSHNMNSFDIRLKKNFKLFISGPSGSGKTFFITDLLKNLDIFSMNPPEVIIYVYRVWQPKYEEMSVDYFIEDGVNLSDKIKSYSKGQHSLVVFDDLINSDSTPEIARLFTVDGRHSNMSLIFVTQKMFVNEEKFREISGNSDYFLVFKNPRNAREIRTLASQMTPGKMDLVNYYVKATEKPFSYLLINLTQQCEEQVRFLSHLFDVPHVVRAYFNSTYLSLHDSHLTNRTNYSKMFLTNEIVEECTDCNCIDEKGMPHREENDMELDDLLKHGKFKSSLEPDERVIQLSRNIMKYPERKDMKTQTCEKVIMEPRTEENRGDSNTEHKEGRNLIVNEFPINNLKSITYDSNDINRFGGSFSSDTWNKLNEEDQVEDVSENNNIRFTDLGESMQIDDSNISEQLDKNLEIPMQRNDCQVYR